MNVVQLLIQYGIDINQVDTGGENGFHFACRQKNLHIIKYLQKQNVNLIHQRNFDDKCGLELLIKCSSEWETNIKLCLIFLVESGAELNRDNRSRRFNRRNRDEIVKAIEDRINELTFTKQELFRKFTGRVAQVITEFTTESCTNVESALENLRQALETLSH